MYKNKTFQPLLLVIFMALTAISCIREDEGDCEVAVRFVCTYNILSADALIKQVDEVTLCVFGNDGILSHQYSNIITSSSPVIRLTDLKSGNYHFFAWAQSKHVISDQSYFLFLR